MDDFITWLTATLAAERKSQRALARHLKMDPSSVNLMFKGKRRVQLDEYLKIIDFVGKEPPPQFRLPGISRRAENVTTAPVKGIAMERTWREDGAVPAGRQVAAVLGSEYPTGIQYALEVDDPERPEGVASEYVLCVPVNHMHRPIRIGDLLHCERKRSDLSQIVLRRVVLANDKRTLVVDRGETMEPEPLSNYAVIGFVIGRTERYV